MARRVDVTPSEEDRAVLERWARRPKSAQALALRCRIVLAAAEGAQSKEIAERLGTTTRTVGRWRGRFAARGIDGLHDEPRPGRPRKITDGQVEQVIVKTRRRSRPTPPTGRRARWPPRPASTRPRSAGSGGRSG